MNLSDAFSTLRSARRNDSGSAMDARKVLVAANTLTAELNIELVHRLVKDQSGELAELRDALEHNAMERDLQD